MKSNIQTFEVYTFNINYNISGKVYIVAHNKEEAISILDNHIDNNDLDGLDMKVSSRDWEIE